MRLFSRRKPGVRNSTEQIGARCPDCRSELPILFEQALRLVDGEPVWLFCPLCKRIVSAVMFDREQIAAPVNVVETTADRFPSPAAGALQLAR
ncbi:MAG TPA: hypothetical protein VFA28_13250 [Bryobacteraceae bacterium]|jgi:hypothetical protein|nr:hypothetical protein [Bryobacteraceae bacterium]